MKIQSKGLRLIYIIGVFFMFYFSSLGGFGANAPLSWWWATLILPYPIGWLLAVIVIITRALKKKKQTVPGPVN